MFKIEFMDIGGDGLHTESQANYDTLVECEILAAAACAKHLGVTTVSLVHDEDLLYRVYVSGHDVGLVKITSL